MTDVDRREFLLMASILAASGLSGCAGAESFPSIPDHGDVVDVHCHLFNGTDIPVVRFFKEVVIPDNNPDQCTARATLAPLGAIQDPTLADLALQLFVSGYLRRAPTAADEATFLKANKSHLASTAGQKAQAEEDLVPYLSRSIDLVMARGAMNDKAAAQLDLILQAARAQSPEKSLTAAQPDQVARAAIQSDTPVGRTLRWMALFRRYRHSLADELAGNEKRNGRTPRLLVPLMVDYAHWLGEDTDAGSSFHEQAEVFGEIAKRRSGPAVHGMIAYDPLRAVFRKRNKRYSEFKSRPFNPLDLARSALSKDGFIGLKVYPPMGFWPVGNTDDQGYQTRIREALCSTVGLGRDLDEAMDEAYRFCVEQDAPMIAHANFSVGAGKDYGARASPARWIQVMKKWPHLRLCLAHQGRFCWLDPAAPLGTPADQRTWEWAIGRYVRDNPSCNLYLDLSYLSEVTGSDEKAKSARTALGPQLQSWINECDRQCRHILFGTDWIMLGRDSSSPVYLSRIESFLVEDCKLSAAQVSNIMISNAARYLGLGKGQTTRQRLDAFYASNGLSNKLGFVDGVTIRQL